MTPSYHYRKLVGNRDNVEPMYQTRQKVGGDLIYDKVRLELTKKSWRWRVKSLWRGVPPHIRGIDGDIPRFKVELKQWLKIAKLPIWGYVGYKINVSIIIIVSKLMFFVKF